MTTTAPRSASTLEERAALTNGASFWATRPVDGAAPVTFSDGPNGVRAQDMTQGADHLGLRPSIPATCFPPAVALSQTWDAELIREVGRALGREARAASVQVLNGPGVNLKRDPRAGRNFEYYSEDPYLTGVLASAWVEGVQSEGVGTALKHFAANETEHERFRTSSDVDERTLRELYLRPFQRVVQTAKPWTVMCSYNRINGVPAAANRWLLTDVLRGEWGFDGLVVSDWGAVDDRVASVRAGLDLAMPGGDAAGDARLVRAVQDGELDESALDAAADRVAQLLHRAAAAAGTAEWDADDHHALARRVAGRAVVLLKNDGDLLPLAPGGSIAVIGELARTPRYQGGGSAAVNATRVDQPLEEIRALAPEADVRFAAGYASRGGDTAALREEAVALAAGSETAVLFLGVPHGAESEGFDRDDIELPADQIELVRAVAAVQPRTVVVLAHGSALRLAPVAAPVPALLDGALLGQASGGAIADVLFGVVNPSGRLTETAPVRLQDVPAWGAFPGEGLHTRYAEGVFVGYRSYDHRDIAVAFPFGHGLSYTGFEYADLVVTSDADGIDVEVAVRNTGARRGREVVQVYVSLDASAVSRAPKELKGFTVVDLDPGAQERVRVRILRADLAYWDVLTGAWVVEGGTYGVHVAASSRDIRLSAEVPVEGDPATAPLTPESSVAEVLADPVAGGVLGQIVQAMFGGADPAAEETGVDLVRMIGTTPVGRFTGSLGDHFTREQLEQLLAAANAAAGR